MSETPEQKNVILKVSEECESNMEALFNVLTSENAQNGQSTKKSFGDGLPPSFHRMPEKSEKTVGPPVQVPHGQLGQSMGLKGPHNRVISLPVELECYPRNSLDCQNMPLPPGWEVGKTPEGNVYFIK